MRPEARPVWVAAATAIAAGAGFLLATHLVFVATPLDAVLGFTQKIFYFHVPCAWITYLAFFVGSFSGVVYLFRRTAGWDHLAHASIEVGTVFTTLVLLTGPLWAKPAWGAYWVWDARLTTTLVLWLIEIAYLLLRAFVEEPDKAARFCAVLGLLGAIDVPVIHFSVVLWRGLHPQAVVLADQGIGAGLPTEFLVALGVSLAAFTLFFALLVSVRFHVLHLAEKVEILRHSRTIDG